MLNSTQKTPDNPESFAAKKSFKKEQSKEKGLLRQLIILSDDNIITVNCVENIR